MKSKIVILVCLSLILGCNSLDNTNTSTEIVQQQSECPTVATDLPLIEIDDQEYGFHNAFNYQIQQIIADPDTITFKSYSHKFTLCRANNSWIIETRTQAESEANWASGQYKNIELDGKQYQYQVKLSSNSAAASDRAIFELITPKSSNPKQQILYNLEQTKQAGAGIELGEPEISQPIVYDNRMFWSVFTYRGEGFGGIATIVSYDPATDKITVIQPPEIATQIVNDLVISGNSSNPTFWIATQLTGEGNPYIPSMGLVAYRPHNSDYTQGTVESYRVRNSPIVGAIPTKLHLEQDLLWLGTGNGICQIQWQTIDNNDSWTCWRFALEANLPSEGLPIYSSLLDNTVDATINLSDRERTVEVLWWLPKQHEPVSGRYEIIRETPITVEFTDTGAMSWNEYYYDNLAAPIWEAPLYWVGSNWHWNGNRFIRGLDEVELNLVGGGVMGISSGEPNENYIFDTNSVRGDLELLELTKDTTKVKHYSAWVEDSLLQLYLTIIPASRSLDSQPNPLLNRQSNQ